MREVKLNIDNETIGTIVDGYSHFGDDEVMLLQDDDLSKNTGWNEIGYTIAPFLPEDLFQDIYQGITDIIRGFIELEVGKPIENFSLEKYHVFCADNDLHLAVVKHFQKCLLAEKFPIDYRIVEQRVSEICGVDVTIQHPDPEAFGKFFCMRIVRPQRKTDNNPPHRDVWLSKLRNSINMYLPISGSNEKSSLPLIPGSHFWKESDVERTLPSSKVNNVTFVVPSVVDAKHSLKMIRPVAKRNEVLIFSPYLVHGGGSNLNEDVTRVSIEMRFWRKKNNYGTIASKENGNMSMGNEC